MLYQNLKSYFNKKKKQWIVKRRVIEFKKKFIRLQKEKNIEQQLQKNIIACIQKKLNYSVIIDECKARIEWCIENVKEDINQIFIIEANQLQLYKENIVSKIRRIIFNKISGKSKYKRFLENYQSEYLKDIKSKNNIKIIDILIVLKGIKKQMEETKKQISKKYKEMLYA